VAAPLSLPVSRIRPGRMFQSQRSLISFMIRSALAGFDDFPDSGPISIIAERARPLRPLAFLSRLIDPDKKSQASLGTGNQILLSGLI